MVKNFINWLKYSGVWCTIILNPFHWSFSWEVVKQDPLNPKMTQLDFKLGPVRLLIVFDNGEW